MSNYLSLSTPMTTLSHQRLNSTCAAQPSVVKPRLSKPQSGRHRSDERARDLSFRGQAAGPHSDRSGCSYRSGANTTSLRPSTWPSGLPAAP
jgi:hypothetical protein